MKNQEQKEEMEKEFFDKLSEKLEEIFPKGKTKCRSSALVFNAHANIIFREFLEKVRKEEQERIKIWAINNLCSCNERKHDPENLMQQLIDFL